jgi:1,4-dihydroxy-2-naphthoate octaprenyltransferase
MTELTLKPWILAARPKTLVATFAPILMGAVLAYRDGAFAPLRLAVVLLSALFIQIGTNLANDFYDFKKGADTADRVGPIRVTQSGLIKARTVFVAAALSFGLAALLGLYLVIDAGMVIVWVGLASIISGVAYTAGPWPLAYVGLGELFVLVFFGPVASGFTYFVLSHHMDAMAFGIGLCPGALSCAILVANNLRDVDQDKRSKKRTLAVRFGKNFARFEYAAFWGLSYFTLAALAHLQDDVKMLLPLLTAPLALSLIRRVFSEPRAIEMIRVLEGTAKALALFTLLFCIGVLL